MNYPDALIGVKRIKKSQLIALIAVIIAFVAALLMLVAAVTGENDEASAGIGAVAGIILLAVTGILFIIAFIINLSGVISARKDEPLFNRALLFIILGIAASLLSTILSSNETVSGLLSVISDIASLFVMIFIIQGISALAKKLERTDMVDRSAKLVNLILVSEILAIIAKAVSTLFEGNRTVIIIATILGVVSALIDVVVFFIYYRYLGSAEKMLEA